MANTYKVIEFPFIGNLAALSSAINKESSSGGTWKIVFVESNPSCYRVWFKRDN